MRPDLPPGFVARRTGGPPVPTRDAATVVLLRDGERGVEGFLLRRVRGMAFAAGMTVFPGGSVDPDDERVDRWVGPPATAWTAALSATEPRARALVCAAVRETFEESGVLLAGSSADDVVDVSDWDGDWAAECRALVDRRHSLAALLERRGLVLRADLLRPWAHWITPEEEPKRFDTRFFVAALPSGQSTRDLGGESDHTHWARPADALAMVERGELGMLPPTWTTLTEIAEHDTVADVLVAAEQRRVEPVMPRVLVDGDRAHIVLPGEPGYTP